VPYSHDVFLSYPRLGSIKRWVPDVLQPLLEEYLSDELGRAAKIYLDVKDEGPGARWPEDLSEAHLGSRVFVPVLSAPFFRSGWCMSEWSNAIKREEIVRTKKKAPPKLIIPIRFNDTTEAHIAELGAKLSNQVRARIRADFGRFNTLVKNNVMSEMSHAYEFRTELQTLCEKHLADAVRQAPPWDASWPRLPEKPISGQDPSWRPRI
jgi:hypothetical protein